MNLEADSGNCSFISSNPLASMTQSRVELILASASSRRRMLLDKLGLHYNVYVPNISESPIMDEPPDNYVQRIAQDKARVAWQKGSNQIPVLAADTIIKFEEKIIGKPENHIHAEGILHMLAGHEHIVYTAICLWTKQNIYQAMSTTIVRFRNLNLSEIHAYCATEEPYDKAGAYAIQGHAANFVEYISGSYTGVVGLPLAETQSLLLEANLIICNPL